MHCISFYGALSLHNCSSSGTLVFTHLGSITTHNQAQEQIDKHPEDDERGRKTRWKHL